MSDKPNWFDYVPVIIAIPITVVTLCFIHLFVPQPWHKHFGID